LKRAVVIAGLLGVTFVGAASGIESTIYPGVGIGGVKLGMTAAQVEKILGKDYIVSERETIGGAEYVEFGWNLSTSSVGFLKQGSRYRAVRVGTTLASQRTPSGVRPGTLWLKLVKAYPHGICTWQWWTPYGLEYLVPHKGGTQTLYTFRNSGPPPAMPGGYRRFVTFAVAEVVVRTPYQALPEFAPKYKHRCREGWQTTPKPQPNP